MAVRPSPASSELEHPPAVSGTPTAWITLALLGVIIAGWFFLNPLACALIRAGITATALWSGDRVSIGEVSWTRNGWIQLKKLEWTHGAGAHPSTLRSDGISIRTSPFLSWIFPRAGSSPRPIQELLIGRSRLLVDLRTSQPAASSASSSKVWSLPVLKNLPLLPASLGIGPMDLVIIGEGGRFSMSGLTARLPERWPGRISYSEATLDAGSWHRAFPAASAPAIWEAGGLHAGQVDFGGGIQLRELSLALSENRLEFGFRGGIGRGALRGDGAVNGNQRRLELTMVGESLSLDALADLFHLGKKATGSVAQARFTFRGNPSSPLEADSSLRVVARDFRWEGRGWESLRLSAMLTGRNLTLGELALRQGRNEVVAEGRSRVPSDWRLVPRAPFTAGFHASLEDAGALASLVGPATGLPPLSGSLELQGSVRGADNRAEGSCSLSGYRMRIRDLPLDWVRADMAFEGDRTRLVALEAHSGADGIRLEGEAANARPHGYQAKASLSVGDITKRLAQLGLTANPVLSGGGVRGTWEGTGEITGGMHTGSFRADVSEWVSRWTRSGVSGSFEGGYAPGSLELTKADLTQNDLKLSLRLQATPSRLTLTDLTALRSGTAAPLVSGEFTLPVDLRDLVAGRDPRPVLAVTSELRADLMLHGIRAEEITQLFGQADMIRGSLEGTIRAAGTLSAPELHTQLKISGFSAAAGDALSDFAISADSAGGRVGIKASDQKAGVVRMVASLDLPLQSLTGSGRLMIAGPEGRVTGKTLFHAFPLDGWARLLGYDTWPFRASRLDGETALAGTVAAPDVSGTVILSADHATLPGGLQADAVSMPCVLTPGHGVMTNGTARLGAQPVALTGDLQRASQGCDGLLTLSGTGFDLPLGLGAGLGAKGNADFNLTVLGGRCERLAGSVQVTSFTGSPRVVLKPSALFLRDAPAETLSSFLGDVPLDLTLRTDAVTSFGRNALVALNLHATGPVGKPRWAGDIALKDTWASFPAGQLFIPSATLVFGAQGVLLSPSPAFACSDHGMVGMELAGPVDALEISDLQSPAKSIHESLDNRLMEKQGGKGRFGDSTIRPWEPVHRWRAILATEGTR